TKLLVRAYDLPSDTLLHQLRPYLVTTRDSQWNTLHKSNLWNTLPLPCQDTDRHALKIATTQFRTTNFTNMLTKPNNICLAACRPYICIDPILWLPMTTKERSRVVRWRIGFLPGKPVPCWCHRDGALTTTTHLIECFHLHAILEVPDTATIDPISFVLNKLPKKPPKEQRHQQY
ncbi:hypothetical protein INT45_012966, partial [Circinella minor]